MVAKPRTNSFEKLGLLTPLDFALHLPIRYEDETRLWEIEEAMGEVNTSVQVQGVVVQQEVAFRPRRQLIVTLQDESGSQLKLRWLNFYPSQQKQMSVGQHLRVRGVIRGGFWGSEIVHPTVRVVCADDPLPNTLTPVYSTVAGISQLQWRRAIKKAFEDKELKSALADLIPDDLLKSCLPEVKLPSLWSAINQLHHPKSTDDLQAIMNRTHPAWRRIQVEEVLAQQLSLLMAKEQRLSRQGPTVSQEIKPHGYLQAFLEQLPFELTSAQQKVWREIQIDLARAWPMNRLLQGDVGSGKTIVAALAALHMIDYGWQVAVMAPTEILAEQHYRKMSQWFEPLGIECVWLTGSLKAKDKRAALEQIASGQGQLIIGTHALIQEGVRFKQLGLAIIDEQHRFGVKQRLKLQQKIENLTVECHQLMMSATPIPRTMAMALFADLEISVIDELPPGRTPITTKLVKNERRTEVIEGLRREVKSGRQVYWVCPLIEESEALELQNAIETFDLLSKALAGFSVGLIHGRLKSDEKNATMKLFAEGKIDVLVATTVIEVGVDVPNASLMVIEHAERFGYAQLHQLRGRVGRGSQESMCILLYEANRLSDMAKERLQTMKETQDGFLIAEKDLEQRGPGELLGDRQSGDEMLRFVDYQNDSWLIAHVQSLALALLKDHLDIAHQHLQRWLKHRADYLKA